MSRASITTTLKVDDKATPAIKNIMGQMSTYQKNHAEAIKQIDKQNIASAQSEAEATKKVQEALKNKTVALQEIQNSLALMTKKQKKEYNNEIDSLKAKGNQEQELLGKDLQYTRAYYNTKLEIEKEALRKQKSTNRSKIAPLERDKNLASTSFDSTAMQLETQQMLEESEKQQQKLGNAKKQWQKEQDDKLYAQIEAGIESRKLQQLEENKRNEESLRGFYEERNRYQTSQYDRERQRKSEEFKNLILTREKESKKELEQQQKLGAELAAASEKKYTDKKNGQEEYKRLYVNTRATNAYNDALKKLNYQKEIGAITGTQFKTALNIEKENLKKADLAAKQYTKSTDNLANATIRYLRWAGTIVGVLYAIGRAWRATAGAGIEMNKMVQNNTFGIAALVSANTRMVDSYGNTFTPMQKFVAGQKIAKERMKELRVEAMKSPATFKEMTDIFQQAIGQTMGMGDAFGETVDAIGKNTVELSSRFSQVAGAIGMPLDRVKEEIRSALTGNVSTDSIISTMLFGSPTKANAAISKARESTNGLKILFDELFKSFDILSTTRTFDKGLNQMKGAWEIAMGDMVAKSGMFKDITDTFYTMSQDIIDNTDEIVKKFDSFYKTLKTITPVIGKVTEAFLIYKAVGITASVIESTAAFVAANLVYDVATKKVVILTTAQKLLNITILKNPYVIAAAAGGIGLNYLIDKTNELHDVTKKTIVDMQSQNVNLLGTKEQLTKELSQKEKMLKVWTEKLEKDKKKYGKDSNIFGIDKAQVEGITQAVKKLNEQLDGTTVKREKDKKALETAQKTRKLLTKLSIDYKLIEEAKKKILKADSEEVKLQKEIKRYTEGIIELKKKLAIEEAKPKPNKMSVDILKKSSETLQKVVKQDQDKIAKIKQDALDKEEVGYQTFSDKMKAINDKAYVEVQRRLEKEKSDKEKVLAEQQKSYELYQSIMGTDYDKWLQTTSEKMSQLSQSGAFTSEQLEKVWEKLQRDYTINLNADAISMITDPLDAMNDKFVTMYENIQNLTGADAWSIEQVEKFGDAVNKMYLDARKQDKKATKYEGIGSKAWTAGLTGQSKAYANIANAISDVSKDQSKYNKLSEDDKKLNKDEYVISQANGYAALAGAMSGVFQEGSSGAQAFQAIQATLGIVSAYTGITTAWASAPFPANLPAVAAASTALLPIINTLTSLGGSGGSGSSGGISEQQRVEFNKQNIDNTYDPITDRLDRQIEILKAINLKGSAGSLALESSDVGFTRDYKNWIEDTILNIQQGAWAGTATDAEAVRKADAFNKSSGKDLYSVKGDNLWLDTALLRESDTLINALVQSVNDKFTGAFSIKDSYDMFHDAMLNGTALDPQINAVINDINELQNAIGDWTKSVLSSMNDLRDTSKEFKDYFDGVTGTDFYKNQRLDRANTEVNGLITKTNSIDFADYLQKNITNIDALDSFFTKDNLDLLIGSDIKDIVARTEKVKELSKLTGETFENGARDALDYLDSIKLMSDAMATSNTNIKSYKDSFKTDTQLTADKLKAINLTQMLDLKVANNYTELDRLFDSLKGGIGGLTDVESEFLSANKDLIDSSASTVQNVFDAWNGSLSYLSLTEKSSLADSFYNLSKQPNSTIDSLEASRLNAEAALKSARTQEEYIPVFNNYIAELQDNAPKNTLDDVVDELRIIADRVYDLEQTTRGVA